MKILATIATFAMAAAVCAQSATIAGSDLIDQIKKPLAATLKKQGVDKLRQKLDSWFNELEPATEAEAE